MKLIDKDAVVAEIKKKIRTEQGYSSGDAECGYRDCAREILSFLNTLEAKDPYEQCIQYDSVKAGIQAHAETYSFNIESRLFNQLTKEQQELWREEIEQACISGGEVGVELARDLRYEENLEAKESHEDIVKYLSEEDERLLSKLQTYVDLECFDRECNGQDLIDWLKSLRAQNTWKPSDEQMKILELIINSHSLDAYHLGMVQHLYNGLKVLKE